jgi:antitoxin (DNA-binding transcriptional repressor) of toxin-antitoxin stability system
MEQSMNATVLDLRKNMKRVLRAIDANERVVLTYRGRTKAFIVPFRDAENRQSSCEHPAFGMWKDREDMADVDGFVRNLRKGRPL